MTGRLIVFEGGEGAGKSTQARMLADRLDAVLTHEPGDTAIGRRIREVVLDPEHPEMHPRTEALLMAADRAQHVAELIGPTLAAGRHVVTDRYVGSSLVYQGMGRGLGVDAVAALSAFATVDLHPDVVILLEIDDDEISRRLDRALDRVEAAGEEFHRRVRAGFADLAAQQGWVVVDGGGSVDDVHARIWAAIEERL